MLHRREFLMSSAALMALAQGPSAGAQTHRNAAFVRLLDDFFNEGLHQRPEQATLLGLDKGSNAALRFKLSDSSPSLRAAAKALTQSQLKRLAEVDAAALSPAEKLDFDVIRYTRESAAAVQAFDFGGAGYGPSPYIVSQNTGAYQSTPEFLSTKHRLETAEDAAAFNSRLAIFATQLDNETDQMRHDAGLGVIPPDFLLDLALVQMTKLRAPAADAPMLKTFAKRLADKQLGGDAMTAATEIYTTAVLPALDRQIAAAKELRARATHDAGLWKQHQGDAFYEVALHNTTTTRLSPKEVHQFGLDQTRDISARLDSLMKAQGLTKGTVGQRMAALYKDPAQLYANTDAGKVQAIAYCNDRLAAIRARLLTVFTRLPPYKFEVRRVPVETEAGAAGAFSQAPALDGSRPGLVYFNLRDSADWPKLELATTVFHEGLPGHQMESGLALANAGLPLIRKTIGFSGYAEGWALYAEQLADEIGMYDDDPLGRLGYLRAQLFRANRCVVDTGLHHYRWSRERAIAYFVESNGDTPGSAAREVERYCSTPGQACSYKLGHSVFTKLRTDAKAKQGARFDIKAFHDAVLGCGRVPLDILEQVGRRWIDSV